MCEIKSFICEKATKNGSKTLNELTEMTTNIDRKCFLIYNTACIWYNAIFKYMQTCHCPGMFFTDLNSVSYYTSKFT